MRRRYLTTCLLSAMLLLLTACATGTGTGVISGTLHFSQTQPPPADRNVTVEIYGFVTMESPATFISRAYIPSTGSSTLPFAIAYDKARIVPKDIYIVQAYIEEPEGGVSWKSSLWNVIITQGRPTDEIALELRPN